MNLVIVNGPEQGRRFALVPGRNVLGRADDCTIQLPSNQISRRHACLTFQDGRVFLEDQGSANGTFFQGRRLSQGVELRPGMQFQLGEFTLTVEESTVPLATGSPSNTGGIRRWYRNGPGAGLWGRL